MNMRKRIAAGAVVFCMMLGLIGPGTKSVSAAEADFSSAASIEVGAENSIEMESGQTLYYKADLTSKGKYSFDVDVWSGTCSAIIYDSKGEEAESIDSTSWGYADFTVLETGTYYFAITYTGEDVEEDDVVVYDNAVIEYGDAWYDHHIDFRVECYEEYIGGDTLEDAAEIGLSEYGYEWNSGYFDTKGQTKYFKLTESAGEKYLIYIEMGESTKGSVKLYGNEVDEDEFVREIDTGCYRYFSITPDNAGTTYMEVTSDDSVGDFYVSVRNCADTDKDTKKSAKTIKAGKSFSSNLWCWLDTDWYKIKATKTGKLKITIKNTYEDEEAISVKVGKKSYTVKPGKSKSVTLNVKKGKYVYVKVTKYKDYWTPSNYYTIKSKYV